MEKKNELAQTGENNKIDPPDEKDVLAQTGKIDPLGEKNKYLRISFVNNNSRIRESRHNIILMPTDFDAFKTTIAQLYAIKEGTSFDCRIDEYHVALPGDYGIIRDHGRVSVVCYDNAWRCTII